MPNPTWHGGSVTDQQNIAATSDTTGKGSEEVDGGLQEDLPVSHPITIRILSTSRHSLTPLRPANTTFAASMYLRPLRFAGSATSNRKNKISGGGEYSRR